jgi:DNA (cytosine-5)-methyltransferase 1
MKEPFLYNMDFVRNQSNKKLFNVVSMFAGGGGSSTGYRLAGGNILAINEFVESARQTYKLNYPETHIFSEDIRDLTSDDILNVLKIKRGELDLLDGSPPCSSFSIAGAKEKLWGEVKKYSDTEQRTDDLFFEFARILQGVQPKVFICENVKGLTQGASKNLLGSEQTNLFGEHKSTIYHTLSDCGYNVRFKVLNAKDFSVPQNRERTIIIGVRKDINKTPTFPLPSKYLVNIGSVVKDMKYISCVGGFGKSENRIIKPDDVCYTITEDGLGAGRRYRIRRESLDLSIIPMNHRKKYFSMEDFNDLIYKDSDNYKNETRLSIPELKAICSFPTDYKLEGSYSKQWERLGRAVPPLMMKSIAETIYHKILN